MWIGYKVGSLSAAGGSGAKSVAASSAPGCSWRDMGVLKIFQSR